MAYKQPKVPQMQGSDSAAYLHALVLFLREDCMAGWNADRQKDEEIDKIKKRLDSLEGKGM